MTTPKSSNGWGKKELHVLSSLARIEAGQAVLHGDVSRLNTAVAKLQVKAGIWGLVGGMIPVTFGVAYLIFS